MRHILKLYRSLEEPIPHIPHNYQFITFDPEIHADAWLELNNFIFAHHPDQGNWVMKDLENRMLNGSLEDEYKKIEDIIFQRSPDPLITKPKKGKATTRNF